MYSRGWLCVEQYGTRIIAPSISITTKASAVFSLSIVLIDLRKDSSVQNGSKDEEH